MDRDRYRNAWSRRHAVNQGLRTLLRDETVWRYPEHQMDRHRPEQREENSRVPWGDFIPSVIKRGCGQDRVIPNRIETTSIKPVLNS